MIRTLYFRFAIAEYVDFDPVMRWDTAYSLTIALVLFIAVIQLFQPMDFSQQLTALKVKYWDLMLFSPPHNVIVTYVNVADLRHHD